MVERVSLGERLHAQPWRFGLALVAAAAVFAIDLQTPWGVASWILYAFPMFLFCRYSGHRHLVPFAALVSVLIAFDHWFSEPAAPLAFSIFNRAAGLVTLWTTVWLLVRRERAHRALEQLRDELEIKVAERTAELQATNDALMRAQAKCGDSEAQLRAVLEHSSDIVIVYDGNLLARYANASVKRLLGYEPGEVVGKYGLAAVHPEDVPEAAAAFARVLADPACVERREARLLHKDGSHLWFESVARHYPGDPGERGVVVNSREIGEHRRALAELRRSEEEFRVLFENSPAGIARAAPDGRYTLANPAMCRLLGYSADELLRLTISDVTCEEDASANEALRQRLYRGEIPHFAMEKRYRRKDGGQFWGRVTVAAVRDERGAVLYTFGTTEDITGQKDSERLRIEALERQRDALVREVHHRIKNNLQGVIGLLERHAREHLELEAPMRAAMARVNAIAALHGLYADSPDARVNLCDVSAAVSGYIGMLFPAIPMRVEVPEGWRKVQLDEQEAVSVALVVNELLLNAAKSCERERCIEPVRLGIARDGSEVCISITNAAGRLPEGFDFASARGLGTGLTLARSLLPPRGARLTIRQLEPQGVEAKLFLSAPVIVDT